MDRRSGGSRRGNRSGRQDDGKSADDFKAWARTRDQRAHPTRFEDLEADPEPRRKQDYPRKASPKIIGEVRQSQEVTHHIKAIFHNRIDPQKGLEFLETHGKVCGPVPLADILSRLGRSIALVPFSERKDLRPHMSLLKKAFECFHGVAESSSPRELSTCIRVLGRYVQYFDRTPIKHNVRLEAFSHARGWYDEFVPRWTQQLLGQPPVVDCTEAIMGMTGIRCLLQQTVSGNSELVRNHIVAALKATCQALRVRLEGNPSELDAKSTVHLVNLMRHMIDGSILSESLFSCLHDLMWKPDRSGRSPLDCIGPEYRGGLSFKIAALYAASAIGFTNLAGLKSVERELMDLVNNHSVCSKELFKNGNNLAEMMGEFLTAAVMHSYKPSDELLNFVAERLPQMLGAHWYSSAQKSRAASYATMALQIMGRKLSPPVAEIAAIVARSNSAERLSVLEAPVERVLSGLQAEGVLRYQRNFLYAPLSLDFGVIMGPASEAQKTVALEIDGFPHHSIFQIDRQEFSETIPRVRDALRDKLICESAGWPLVRVKGYMLDLEDPQQMRSVLLNKLYKAINKVPPANG